MAKNEVSNKTLIIAKLIGTGKSILDCGCGNGKIGRMLKESGNQVVGVEVDFNKAQVAKQSCDKVIIANLETEREKIFTQLDGFYFDCILFSDVLEHLINPLSTLKRYIVLLKKPEGRVIISLPNVAYWRIRLHLFWGRWDYRDEGILDKTHLHFFTLRTSFNLFSQAGLKVVELRIPHDSRRGWLRRSVVRVMHRLTSPSFHAATFVFKLIPNTIMKENNGDSINS